MKDIEFDKKGIPRSRRFEDTYFSGHEGLLETQHVFCKGNDLTARFCRGAQLCAPTFYIIETGFGTGLNFLVAWELWRRCAGRSSRLHFISIEQFPLEKEEMQRAMTLWPTLGELGAEMISRYAPDKGGMQEIAFDEGAVTLTVVFDEVLSALKRIEKMPVKADAWFLDGFAPARNPGMWRAGVFREMALLSRPGSSVATFTAAGEVRRQLQGAGFDMKKVKGFGNKRHMLQGVYKP